MVECSAKKYRADSKKGSPEWQQIELHLPTSRCLCSSVRPTRSLNMESCGESVFSISVRC
jgi:hypothetical protein